MPSSAPSAPGSAIRGILITVWMNALIGLQRGGPWYEAGTDAPTGAEADAPNSRTGASPACLVHRGSEAVQGDVTNR